MMDQLDFENCIEKMKRRREEGDIKTAAKIADKVPWDEVEDINVLIFAANIYEEAEHYKDAKAILDYAYEIAPVKERLYFSLSLINAKLKDLQKAIDYYIDFYNAFPEDNRKILLKYYILKAKGASYDQQKRVLSEYVKEEKDEKMILELALLSDKLGEKEEVLTYCEYIINFFGVKKTGCGKNALLLKKKYERLTEKEESLLVDADIGYVKEGEEEIEYKEPPRLYNESRISEDKRNIPIEKVHRVEPKSEKLKEEELDETKVEKSLHMTYIPDEDSYAEKEKESMAFLSKGKETDKEKVKKLIKELKKEESEKEEVKKDMKLADSKLNMIIEAHSKDEGIEIAKKEITYIRDVLGDKANIAKASAYNMNEKGFAYYADKIVGRDLIIENAGKLTNVVVDEIEEYIINKKGKTIFALVDVINNFDKLAIDRPTFVGRFDVYSVLSDRPQETLEVSNDAKPYIKESFKAPKTLENTGKYGMNVDSFVEECKKYAKSIDCILPGETIPALYEKVEEMQEEKIPFTKENAMALIEEAADRAEKKGMFKKPKYDKEGCLIILPEHFAF